VLYELEQILVSVVNAETGARGFVITGKETYLEPFEQARLSVFQHLQQTKQLTEANSTVQEIISRVEALVDPRLKHLEKYIEVRRTAGFEEAQKIVESGEGRILQDQIRDLIDQAKQIEQALLDQRRQASEEDTRDFNLFFLVLLLVITITLIIVYAVIITNLNALRKAERETADKNWNLAGSSDLTKSMQGNQQVIELTQVIVSHLSRYLDAQVGAVYLNEGDHLNLRLSATYALDKRKSEFPVIRFGEGVAGQAAAERKTILISDIPKDYFTIQTSFGDVLPRNIIAIPFTFEDKVIGVIELGSINDFTKLRKEYLELVTNSIAIAVTSAQSREQTKELLEETQRQAEELEAQQEELKQSNEELHAKTELLEKSEIELKTQQEELQQANIELEEKANMLEEQKAKLEYAKTEIENKANEIEVTSRYKSEFLANMSHELRTPLNSILILSQLLAENKNNKLGKKEVEYATNIHNSGTDLLNLINEILDLAKVESGKVQLEIGDVSLQGIIDSLLSTFSELAKGKEIDFSIVYNKKKLPAVITTDELRVEQIVKNFLSNAFKFTDRGGEIILTVDKPPEGFSLKSQSLSDAVITFSVSDTGIGIPVEKQEIIFEAFQQADGSTKRKYGGTGLGLSISRELTHVLGGELHLESEEGKGSTFTLYLPVHFDPSFVAPISKPVEIKQPKKKEVKSEIPHHEDSMDDRQGITENDRIVLIIEDEESFARLLLDFVRERKYKGIIAQDGSTGVSYARHFKPDAILLDMKLPVMDGTEVLKQLKNDPDTRHIPVQIISAFDKKKEGLALGAFDYIKKPVSPADLQAALDRIENFANKKLKKLLIVEDNKQHNQAIRELIGNHDVKCFSAYSGSEANEIMSAEFIDCIIVDLGLPDMSGFDLLEKIKSDDRLSKIPVIVYTGKDLKKEDNARLQKLADTVVLKTADSKERLLDEAILFLHRVESKLPKEKQNIIRKLHKADEVLKNKKILLVDDDIRNIYSLTNALEDEGIRCVTAENGKVALEILQVDPSIDLVLMDIMMPEMDGYEATVEIRKIEKLKKLPVIALTAKAMKGDKEKCLAVGMSDYISKPVNIEQLLALLRVWLYK
jgi:CheY-like chemotaxis protein/signal transduction histidine kinase/CHASE3 domain sensor protein